jgi:propionyl-CoA carboxylase alpha chain
LSKVLQCGIITKEMEQEAEIAALIALQRYFEDQKIVRLPN